MDTWTDEPLPTPRVSLTLALSLSLSLSLVVVTTKRSKKRDGPIFLFCACHAKLSHAGRWTAMWTVWYVHTWARCQDKPIRPFVRSIGKVECLLPSFARRTMILFYVLRTCLSRSLNEDG